MQVASSVAHGVGALTFDEQHELMRRRMLRCQPQSDNSSALSHFYSGVKVANSLISLQLVFTLIFLLLILLNLMWLGNWLTFLCLITGVIMIY